MLDQALVLHRRAPETERTAHYFYAHSRSAVKVRRTLAHLIIEAEQTTRKSTEKSA